MEKMSASFGKVSGFGKNNKAASVELGDSFTLILDGKVWLVMGIDKH